MGCSYNIPSLKNCRRTETPVGILEIEILNLHIDPSNHILGTENKYVRLAMSNQEFEITSDFLDSSKRNRTKIVFSSFVNSFYKENGRMLMASMWSSNANASKFVQTKALGIVDLNPFIRDSLEEDHTKCYINFAKTPAGYLNLKIHFKEIDFYNLNFSITDFHLQKSLTGRRLCFCKVTAGEETLQTDISAEFGSHRASWKNQILSFAIPQKLNKIDVQILQKVNGSDIILAEGVIHLEELTDFANKKQQLRFQLFNQSSFSVGFVQIKVLEESNLSKTAQAKVNYQLLTPQKTIQAQEKKSGQSMRVILDNCCNENDKTTLASQNTIFTEKKIGYSMNFRRQDNSSHQRSENEIAAQNSNPPQNKKNEKRRTSIMALSKCVNSGSSNSISNFNSVPSFNNLPSSFETIKRISSPDASNSAQELSQNDNFKENQCLAELISNHKQLIGIYQNEPSKPRRASRSNQEISNSRYLDFSHHNDTIVQEDEGLVENGETPKDGENIPREIKQSKQKNMNDQFLIQIGHSSNALDVPGSKASIQQPRSQSNSSLTNSLNFKKNKKRSSSFLFNQKQVKQSSLIMKKPNKPRTFLRIPSSDHAIQDTMDTQSSNSPLFHFQHEQEKLYNVPFARSQYVIQQSPQRHYQHVQYVADNQYKENE